MIDKKIALKVLLWVVATLIVWGIALPFLISAKSTELVVAGIVLILLFLIIAGNEVINLINKVTKKDDEESND